MFDLSKDIDQYRGIPPYASELYGVYQPLLGWQSSLTKQWIRRNSAGPDVRVRRILDAWIVPGPTDPIGIDGPDFGVAPLEVGHGKTPWKVVLLRDFGSHLVELERQRVERWVNDHGGRLPVGDEWRDVVEFNDMREHVLPVVNELVRTEVLAELPPDADDDDRLAARQRFFERMQYESQLGALLIFHAEGQADHRPDALANLFAVRTAPSLDELLKPTDPLEAIDPKETSGALSPVGLVHTFRQWFFDLGTFLGEPVEHVWLAPGTTIELVEVSTRRQLVERTTETLVEQTTRAEHGETSREELSDAVKDENSTNTKLGISTTNTVSLGVYQGNVSANFGIDSTRSTAREVTHRNTREQSQKLATEIRKSVKSMFRTVTEITDTRSKRYVLQNPSMDLVNYELRRKMRRIGVQLQDLGSRLCWQVFVDDPGGPLGLSQLVHFAAAPDLSNLKAPDRPPNPAPITKRVVVPLQYKPVLDYTNNRAQYEFQGPAPNGVFLGIIKGDEDDDDSQIVIEFKGFKFDPPQPHYALTSDIRLAGVQGGKLAVIRSVEVQPDGSFNLTMQRLNFGGENVINLDMDLVFAPGKDAFKEIEDTYAEAKAKYDAEREQELRKSYVEAVKQRIDAAADIQRRPAWDLREEERTVVYRKLIERLMLDTWKLPPTPERARVGHLRSELIRSIFDVDEMMYFVAPEWWMPRQRQSALQVNPDVGRTLSDADLVAWRDQAVRRPDDYLITGSSAPARLGSSLGWLMQLDGDNLRNAFLNAPWVKAVVPVRPGKEREALRWLHELEGHEDDGWDLPYPGNDDPEFVGKTVGQVLTVIADRLEADADDPHGTLAAGKVFEHGFDPLAEGFDAGAPAASRFAQWLTILPTDQIVAVDYEPKTLEL